MMTSLPILKCKNIANKQKNYLIRKERMQDTIPIN